MIALNWTREERLRLVLAASGRGDAAERDRLVRAAGRISRSFPDHAPYARAVEELALMTFIELLDEAASSSGGAGESMAPASEAEGSPPTRGGRPGSVGRSLLLLRLFIDFEPPSLY